MFIRQETLASECVLYVVIIAGSDQIGCYVMRLYICVCEFIKINGFSAELWMISLVPARAGVYNLTLSVFWVSTSEPQGFGYRGFYANPKHVDTTVDTH